MEATILNLKIAKMKQNSVKGPIIGSRIIITIFLTSILLLSGKISSAHKVVKYTVPCFLQGETVSINVTLNSTGYGSYMHWQYRPSPGAAWVWLANGNNMINGRTFYVTGASQPTYIPDSTENLVIANVGSPAYTTQLDNIEFRVLMTDFGLDPETHPWPSIPVYGAEEFNDRDAKYIRIRTKQGGENCYSACTGNMLVLNPAAVPPALEDYYGGFEIGSGSGTDNFSSIGINGTTAKAATEMLQWTGGTLGTNPRYRVIGNADSMNTAFSAFAAHSGMKMMVVNANNSCSNKIWYRTIAVSNVNQFYQGSMIFRGWFAKLDNGANPNISLEIKGGTAVNSVPSSYTSLGSVTQTITGTAGTWVQVSLVINIPVNTYKKLEISIKSPNACTTPVNVAIDDLCLIEPVSGILPIVMTPLKGTYSKGVMHLSWSSLQEINSSYFEVEKSNEGTNFSVIGKVNAKGYSETTVNYSFDDIKANAGANYYRLKMVDKDGSYQNSNTVALNIDIKGINITGIYPTPFTDKVNITVSSEVNELAMISLFDNTGKLILTQQNRLNKGIASIRVENLDKLSAGFYFIKIQAGDEIIIKKLIK